MRLRDSNRRADLTADAVVALLLIAVYAAGVWTMWLAWRWILPALIPSGPGWLVQPVLLPFAIGMVVLLWVTSWIGGRFKRRTGTTDARQSAAR